LALLGDTGQFARKPAVVTGALRLQEKCHYSALADMTLGMTRRAAALLTARTADPGLAREHDHG
jgi:hypothetical protein